MFCVDLGDLGHLFCGVCTDCYERDGSVKCGEGLESSGYNDTPAAGSATSHSPKDCKENVTQGKIQYKKLNVRSEFSALFAVTRLPSAMTTEISENRC
jgi:hypothetical protein